MLEWTTAGDGPPARAARCITTMPSANTPTTATATSAGSTLLSTTGCGGIKDDKVAMRLESSLSAYRQSIRWGYWDAAAAFLHPSKRTEIDSEALENIRVTSYEVVQPPVVDEDMQAAQLVRIEYVLNDRQRLESLADRQDWRFEEASNAWWLHSSLPKFKSN
jgi:hypothetical protein